MCEEFTSLQKSLIYRAINTERNFLNKLYPRPGILADDSKWSIYFDMQRQVEELNKVEAILYPTQDAT